MSTVHHLVAPRWAANRFCHKGETMKKAFIVLSAMFCVLAFAWIAGAAEVTLAWDSPGNSEWGTRLYIGTATGQYDFSEDAWAGTVQITIANLAPGQTYYFAAKHYFNGMESEGY